MGDGKIVWRKFNKILITKKERKKESDERNNKNLKIDHWKKAEYIKSRKNKEMDEKSTLRQVRMIDFNAMTVHQGLFFAKRSVNHVHWTFIVIFVCLFLFKDFFLFHVVLSNRNNLWRGIKINK